VGAIFQVMRRTHATLMKMIGIDGKLVADQLGHTLDVNQNVYTQLPVESRRVIVNELEKRLLIQCMQSVLKMKIGVGSH
jgi:integrase